MSRFNSSDEIPDEVIKEEFAKAQEIHFSARPNTLIHHRKISFGTLGWWIPLPRVLTLLGITPTMLLPVFIGQRRFNPETRRLEIVDLPIEIDTYEELGSFGQFDRRPFKELARILGKRIQVHSEDGSTGDHHYLYMVEPLTR